MMRDLARKCSYCGQNGHNSRTCNGKAGTSCVKLFGVNILENRDEFMKKSFSMGNLRACDEEENYNDININSINNVVGEDDSGYLSDGLIHNKKRKAAHERKKGTPWTEEEHRTFLAGLKKLGKGNWREIARNYVTTRTPTQVASHAQKYFLRQSANDKKKRRSSLFDMPLKEAEVVAQRSSGSSSIKTAAILSQEKATSSQALKLKSTIENSQTASVTANIANRFPHLCLDSPPIVPISAACPVPTTYHGLQYMVGVQGNISYFQMMNIGRHGGYHYPNSSKAVGTSGSCVPVIAHPSGIPSPKLYPNITTASLLKAGSGSSELKDGLELKIGQPQPSPSSNLSSQSSAGPISVT